MAENASNKSGDVVVTPPSSLSRKARYQVTLNAPTTVLQSRDAESIAYLDQGSTYCISVIDTAAGTSKTCHSRYRTTIQVSFEPEMQFTQKQAIQRSLEDDPVDNWAERGPKDLPTIEYVPHDAGSHKGHIETQVEVDNISFDCFLVSWSTSPLTGGSYCLIPVRFNFIAQDFIPTQRLRGKSLRLSARTEVLSSTATTSQDVEQPEEHCARLMLFAESGAAKQLSDDVAHIIQDIEGLQGLIRRLAIEPHNSHKRQGGGYSNTTEQIREKEAARHDLQRSIASERHFYNNREVVGLQEKLVNLRGLVSSIRPMTTLCHNGVEAESSGVSTRPEHASMRKPCSANQQKHSTTAKYERDKMVPLEITATSTCPLATAHSSRKRGPSCHNKAFQVKAQSKVVGGLKEVAVGNDEQSLPSASHAVCFYIRSCLETNVYHRAIYLHQRTMRALMDAISNKFEVGLDAICWVSYTDSRNVQIIIDEEVLHSLPDGQDMVAQLTLGGEQLIQNRKPVAYAPGGNLTPLSTGPPGDMFVENMYHGALANIMPLLKDESQNPGFPEQMSPIFTTPMETVEFSMFDSIEVSEMMLWQTPTTTATGSRSPQMLGQELGDFQDLLESPITTPTETAFSTSQELSLDTPTSLAMGPIAPRVKRKKKGASGLPFSEEEVVEERSRHLDKNRAAAAKCRVRRKGEQKALEEDLHQKLIENTKLHSTVSVLEAHVRSLGALLGVQAQFADVAGCEMHEEWTPHHLKSED